MAVHVKRRDNSEANAAPGVLARLGLVEIESAYATEAQMAKVRQVAALWPAAMYAQIGAVVIVLACMSAIGTLDQVLAATIPASCILTSVLLTQILFGRRRFWRLAPEHQFRGSLPVALALGGAMAALGWMAQSITNESLQVIAIAALASAAVVTLVALLSMHATMMVFMSSIVIVAMIAANNYAIANIGVALLACLWIAVIAHARFDNLLTTHREMQDSRSQRANRLLTEFEANGNGWFWETDRAGDIVYISEKLAQAIGRPHGELVGRALTDLILSEGGTQDGERTLGFHLSTRSAFKEITVRAAIPDEERWWAISGRPIIDKIGQFRGFVGSGSDLTEKRRSEAEANRLALYDSLTGLANRQQMHLTLREAIARPNGTPNPASLFLLDLDRFKAVNDTMGHPVGDALLKQVAQRLFRAVGDKGMVGRLGGDEFQVVLPGIVNQKELGHVARAIIADLSHPYMIDGVTLTIGCSIGIAIAPEHGEQTEDLIRNADLALYAAKGDGRGVHRFFQSDMHVGATRRKRIEDDLRRALPAGELTLAYQPVVSTANAQIVGYETLLRWNHPSRGAISPAEFIPIAEDVRMIEEIGEWVLYSACEEAVHWPAHVRVAVNVSPIQFANPALPQIVTDALEKSGLPAHRLELEITESVFLDESADTDKMFKSLKKIGVRLALDDFGTGYSSLGYLKNAPFDKIKIDQSFIRGAAVPGNRNAAIIKAIVTLANTLYMETTAEGVELEDEIELIRELGCSHIQGYIYGKPMAAEEARRQLADHGGKAVASGYRASRSPRRKVLRTCTAEVRGIASKVIIRDISATGALVEGLTNVSVGSDVLIDILEDQQFAATVRWTRETRAGIEFAQSFDMERLNGQPQQPLSIRKVA